MSTRFFEQYLLEYKYITQEQLDKAIQYQDKVNIHPGHYALRKNILTEEQLKLIKVEQCKADISFFELVLNLKILNKEQVDEIKKQFKHDHIYIGEALIKIGAIERSVCEEQLKLFHHAESELEKDLWEGTKTVDESEISKIIVNSTVKMFSQFINLPLKLNNWQLINNDPTISYPLIKLLFSGNLEGNYFISFSKSTMDYTISYYFPDGVIPEGMSREEIVKELVNLIVARISMGLDELNINMDISYPEYYENKADDINFLCGKKNMLFKLESPIDNFKMLFSYSENG